MGVHFLDAAWWLMGMPRPVARPRRRRVPGSGRADWGTGISRSPPREYSSRYGSDDYGCGIIVFEDGSGLQVESHWASHQPEEYNIELFGEEGGARALRPSPCTAR